MRNLLASSYFWGLALLSVMLRYHSGPPDSTNSIRGVGQAGDCVSYDSRDLTKRRLSADQWLVTDGKKFSQRLLREANADRLIALANAYSVRCRVPGLPGRFIDYWKGDGPVRLAPRDKREDCLEYNPSTLGIQASDGSWRLGAGPQALATFSSEFNAEKILQVAKSHSFRCFIGREAPSDTPDRLTFIVGYWR